MIALGQYIQECREAVGLTQEDVASRLHVTARTISAWETGRYSPAFEVMARLMYLIGGQIETASRKLLGDTGPSPVQRIIDLADTDEKRARVLRRVAALTTDPELRARIEGYLDRLEE